MRVYFFGIYNTQGGMESYALNLIKGIKERYSDVEFTLLVFGEEFSNKDKLVNELSCDYLVLPSFKKHPIRFMNAFKKLGGSLNPGDVLQLNVCSLRNYFLLKAASKMPCRKIIVSHYSKAERPLICMHYLNRAIFNRKFENVGVSEEAARFMFGKNYSVIPNGVASANFIFSGEGRKEIRGRYGVEEGTFLIGQVGRISEEKNQLFSLKVLAELCKKHDNVKLMLVGKGDDGELKNRIEEYGLKNNVIMAGVVSEGIGNFYSAFDCYFMPSKNEALSLALIEALCNGLPVIYSTGIPEFSFKDERSISGLWRLGLDAEVWVRCVEGLLMAPAKARPNHIASSEYEIGRFVDDYYDLYARKVGGLR